MLCYVANEMYDMKCIWYEVNKKDKLNHNSSEKQNYWKIFVFDGLCFKNLIAGGWNKNVLGGKKLKNQLAGGCLLGTKE